MSTRRRRRSWQRAWPSSTPPLEARRRRAQLDQRGRAPGTPRGSGEPTSTEILVKGLGSFGAITGFRQALAGVDGIEGVSLSLGPTGEFVFRAIHPTGFDVAAAIAKLEGDAATIEHAARRRPAGHPRPRPLISRCRGAVLDSLTTAMTVRSTPPSAAPERRATGWKPAAEREGEGRTRAGRVRPITRSTRSAEPGGRDSNEGGTTTRSSFDERVFAWPTRRQTDDDAATRAPAALRRRGGRAGDLRALAGGGCLPPGRRRRRPAPSAFVIIQPPPNVTGALHIGHALTFIVEDVMVRYHRMRGDDTLWLPGVDHSGIAAQFVLDKMIADEGESRASLGRERYLERMWQFMDETRAGHPRPASSLRRQPGLEPGAIHDGRGERPRRSRRLQAAVGRGPGLPRRGARQLVPALPDHDQRPRERPSRGDRHALDDPLPPRARRTARPIRTRWISVATTRPETLLGDTAVAVHPDDERYRRLVGRARDPAVPRAPAADRRRRACRARVRHRRGQDHAGPRRRRLRARPSATSLPAINVLDDEARINERRRRLLRPRSLRGARGDPRSAA